MKCLLGMHGLMLEGDGMLVGCQTEGMFEKCWWNALA